MLEAFVTWLPATVFELGYPGIAILMAVESSAIPFPSEVVMPPAGYNVALGKMSFPLVLGSGIAGSLIGALVNYLLARWLDRILRKHGKWILVSPASLDRAEAFFRRHGEIGTFIGRLVPVVRQLISIPAGLARMRMDRFLLYTGLGAGIWCFVLTYIGYILGKGIGILGHWQAFASERGLGGLQCCRFQQPSISRDGVTFLDQNDVAGDDLRGGDAASFSVANDRCVGCGHRSQGRDRGLGPCLLDVAQRGVEQHDGEDGQCFVRKGRVALVGPQAGRDAGGDEQQDDQDVLKLREEPPPRGDGLLSRELVAPVLFKSRSDLGVGQTMPGVGPEHRNDGIRIPSMWLGWIHDIADLHGFCASHSHRAAASTVGPTDRGSRSPATRAPSGALHRTPDERAAAEAASHHGGAGPRYGGVPPAKSE